MALMDFIKKQFIDIIEWTDDSRDTLSYRYPDDDKEIKNNAQLIVRESQVAQFVHAGKYADVLPPGHHTLSTKNIPILSDILGWKYGFESPFKCDVYYVTTRTFTGQKWGTANPVMMRDPDFGVVRLRAFGTYDFKIVDPGKFLREVAGTDNHFRLDEFTDVMRSRIVSVFTEALASAKVPALDVASRYSELGNALLPAINPVTIDKYGLEVTGFIVENVSVPPELEQAIDKRGAMTTIGDMSEYVKYQMAQGLPTSGGTVGLGAELAMGMAMANQMAMNPGANQGLAANPNAPRGMVPPDAFGRGTQAAAVAAAAVASAPAVAATVLLTPAQVAQQLGVGEADVMTILESNELKGKKIGSQWRITQTAVDEFLKA